MNKQTPLYFSIARIIRPRGNKGEVLGKVLTDFPERFQKGVQFYLHGPEGISEWKSVEDVWFHQGKVVLKFEGIDSIGAAQAYRGCEVALPLEERYSLTEENYYPDQIEGLVALDESGREVGIVAQVTVQHDSGLCTIRSTEGEEILVPLARAFIQSIDLSRGQLVLRSFDTLMDVNR